jgi:hypothetical protein
MEATAHIKAVLQNPTGLWEDNIPFEYPSPQVLPQAMMQIAGGITKTGGLARLSAETLEFIPIHRVVNLTIEISTVKVASSLDMAAAVGQAAATKKIITG